MEPQNPLSAKRLYALMGEKMHEFPSYFIERLERKLEQFERDRCGPPRSIHLKVVENLPDNSATIAAEIAEDLRRHAKIAVPVRTLQGLGTILEILHSVHVSQREGDPDALSEHLVEGLIVSGRALVRASTDTAWGEP